MKENNNQQKEIISREATFGERLNKLHDHIDYLDTLPDKRWDDD